MVETFELTKHFQKVNVQHDVNSQEEQIEEVVITEAEIAEDIINN
jgi:hypothetical protein